MRSFFFIFGKKNGVFRRTDVIGYAFEILHTTTDQKGCAHGQLLD